MRPGDKVTFDVTGLIRADGLVVIGCATFTLAEVAGASRSSKVKGDTIKIKGATGTVIEGRDGSGRQTPVATRVEFAGIARKFLADQVESEASNLVVEEQAAAGQNRAQARTNNPDPATLRWQDGDMVVWVENKSGPRYRDAQGRWWRENGARRRTGRRWVWTDARYDEKIAQGKVRIVRKGGVNFE